MPTPAFTGLRVVEPTIAELREMIDWQFLFLAWELKGKYPAILDQPVARELFDDANTMLDEIIANGSLTARGVYGFWPAHSDGDDIVLESGGRGSRCCGSRRRSRRAARTARWPTTSRRPGDHLGGFAVAHPRRGGAGREVRGARTTTTGRSW